MKWLIAERAGSDELHSTHDRDGGTRGGDRSWPSGLQRDERSPRAITDHEHRARCAVDEGPEASGAVAVVPDDHEIGLGLRGAAEDDVGPAPDEGLRDGRDPATR